MGTTSASEKPCNTAFRWFPGVIAIEIAKFFEAEMKMSMVSQWGIQHGRPGCLHWFVSVRIGEKIYTPAMCFTTKKEAETYCDLLGQAYVDVVKVLFGMEPLGFSTN